MTTQVLLAITHIVSFILGALVTHIYYSKKLGKSVNITKSVVTVLVMVFWVASMYKEIFLGGTPTSPLLYAMFGIVQGSVFGFSVENIISYFKK